MRQAGRYLPEYRQLRADAGSFLELCYTPDLAVEVSLQPLRRFAIDAAILFADILLVPHALGQPLEFREGEGPVLEPIRSAKMVAELELARLEQGLEPIYETVRRLSAALPQEVALIGFAGAPWTVAAYMVEGGGGTDFAQVKRWAFRDPDGFQVLIDLLVEATTHYLLAQVRAGAEVLQLFDSWAGVLPETAFQRWCLAPLGEITARLREQAGEVPIIAFPRNVGVGYAEYASSSGVSALSIDPTVSLQWARQQLQPQVAVQGNMDPHLVVVGGAPMQAEAERILDILGAGPFVFNLGRGIVPETPPEHVGELVEFVRTWSG